MADPYDPHYDTPLQIGERVRIVVADRVGSDLQGWERKLAGRGGNVTEVDHDPCPVTGSLIITIALDRISARQRIKRVVRLTLASSWHQQWDIIERLSAPAPAEEEVRRG